MASPGRILILTCTDQLSTQVIGHTGVLDFSQKLPVVETVSPGLDSVQVIMVFQAFYGIEAVPVGT